VGGGLFPTAPQGGQLGDLFVGNLAALVVESTDCWAVKGGGGRELHEIGKTP